MSKIHPTAIVDPRAKIAPEVEIGPYSIVGPDVTIGAGSVLREHVVVRRYTALGEGNFVDSNVVLGGEPQDLRWDAETVSYLRIGDGNVFREGVTISRASIAGQATVVGNRTYWMGLSHAGHDVVVGDEVIICNGVLMGGHARIGPRTFLSGHVLVHQFTWVGEGVMSQGNAGASAHVPPFTLFLKNNRVAGLNVVGMRRADFSVEDRKQVKEAFRLTYRCRLTPAKALEKMDEYTDWGEAAGKFRDFIREVLAAKAPYNRGLCSMLKSAD